MLKKFKCDECDARERPCARRPAAVPKSDRMDHVVGIDLVEVKDPSEETPQFWKLRLLGDIIGVGWTRGHREVS